MLRVGPYVFKRAESTEEVEQVHRLNFQTFVAEIPQYPDARGDRLVDKFHHKNVYFIVLCADQLIGMVSAHDQPPFSVADRLEDPAILSRPGVRPLEVRLLAVEPARRNSLVFFGLIWSLYEYAHTEGYTHLFISGIKERLPLYKRLGFEALGRAVGTGKASFVPMVLTIGQLPRKVERVKKLWETRVERIALSSDKVREWGTAGDEADDIELSMDEAAPVCLLPGPVTTSAAVRQAFHQPPIYHRGPEFIRLFQTIRATLAGMVGCRNVALLNGSGTLGNECVAATLSAMPSPGRGLMLVNGEFGKRLAQQGKRFGLNPRILSWRWGQAWDLDEIDAALATEPAGSWVWGVHQESSTGVLNDLPGLVRLAAARGIRVCVDCISSLGAVPLDLNGVFLATGATGKSLGSFAGISIIFAHADRLADINAERIPSYFDVRAHLTTEGPRFTFPSPLLLALEAALAEYSTPQRARQRYAHYADLGEFVRRQLRGMGIEPLAADACASPVVTTFAPPIEESSEQFVERCRRWGFTIGGQSGYLAQQRMVQIATMGAVTRDDCQRLFDHLARWLSARPTAVEMAR